MVTTFWAVARALFAFVAMMFLLIIILFQALLQENYQVKREQRIFGSAIRPGDIFHPDFADGKPTYAYFDISVEPPLLLALLALLVRWKKMPSTTIMFPVSAGCVFFPLVVETLGLWTD